MLTIARVSARSFMPFVENAPVSVVTMIPPSDATKALIDSVDRFGGVSIRMKS